ncbi:hypothetical protein PIB30_028150 [Stylosanthes scabra]|uniref:Uncharacterized protein n=1 Tax=Stylosanthes scabra TaxID=79078 RepID=A0ABU6X9Q5_9FABA|nr:hypothetical protein [Stylosanthes scabra]
MVEGLDRLPVFLLGMIRETVHWLATGLDRDGLITDLMSSLAVGTGIHHMHLCDIAWFWRFIRTENPWVGDSHSVYIFRLFRYRFKLGKSAK